MARFACSVFLVVGDTNYFPADQRFQLVNVQVVQHNVPLYGFGIAGYQALDMREGIFFGSRRSPGLFDNLEAFHIEVDEPGQQVNNSVMLA